MGLVKVDVNKKPTSQPFPYDRPPTIPQETDSARETNLYAQQVTLLYETLPAALIASAGCALALVVVNWNVLPQGPLLIWLTYHLIISAGRYRLTKSFKATTPTPAAVQRWD